MLVLMLLCGSISSCGYQGTIAQLQQSVFSCKEACTGCVDACCLCGECLGVGLVTYVNYCIYAGTSVDVKTGLTEISLKKIE